MSKPIIEVSQVSKSYVLRHEGHASYKSFRDMLTESTKKLFRFPNNKNGKGQRENFLALNDVSFSIAAGDRVGIIGRNGAGKSTLLKILSRITEPTKGKVVIRGKVSSLLEVGTGFHPELSGRENIFLNGAILGMSRQEIRGKFDEIVAFAEVEKFLDTPVKRYSSGMYVRLAFSVAAHLEPEILIVDEVLAVGDAQFQRKCLGKMQDVSNNEGRTVLIVSHQLGMIQTLCNNCVHLEGGRVQAIGPSVQVIRGYLETGAKVNEEEKNDLVLADQPHLPAQIKSLRLVDENGITKNEFDVFEKRFLEAEVEVRSDKLSFIFYYYLKKNEEVIVCSHENDLDESRLEVRKRGIYKYRISLPVNLKAGTYSFESIGIGIPNQGGIQALENVLEFTLEEFSFDGSLSGYSNKRPGLILADSNYQLTEIKHF